MEQKNTARAAMLFFISFLRARVAFGNLLPVFALLLGVCTTVAFADEVVAAVFAELSLPVPTLRSIVVCHGFGCQFRTELALGNADRAKLTELLASGRASPQAERRALAAAIVWFDRRAGPVAGTTHRVALARSLSDPGQMDCVDLSMNNTGLLVVLDQLHLLRHHHVEAPASRGYLIDGRMPHTSAVVSEIRSGRRWVLDNWTHKYGETPDVKTFEDWMREGY
jgi:hypothetical protein